MHSGQDPWSTLRSPLLKTSRRKDIMKGIDHERDRSWKGSMRIKAVLLGEASSYVLHGDCRSLTFRIHKGITKNLSLVWQASRRVSKPLSYWASLSHCSESYLEVFVWTCGFFCVFAGHQNTAQRLTQVLRNRCDASPQSICIAWQTPGLQNTKFIRSRSVTAHFLITNLVTMTSQLSWQEPQWAQETPTFRDVLIWSPHP